MMDQADNLRNLINRNNLEQATKKVELSSRVITVTSGKGGVGKTNFSLNLAIQLSRFNKKVVIIDADFGLANIEVLFGILPKYNLADVLSGEKDVEEVLTDGPMGIKFISGGSGLKELSNITEKQLNYFINNFSYLDAISDIIIIDTGAGISKSVVNFIKASDETIIVTTPEPTSITDAYALIKTIKEESFGGIPDFKVVVNRADDDNEGDEIFNKISRASSKFLGVHLQNLGYIPYDKFLVKAVKHQQPATLCFPNCEFTKSIEKITNILMDVTVEQSSDKSGIRGFMKRLVNIFGN